MDAGELGLLALSALCLGYYLVAGLAINVAYHRGLARDVRRVSPDEVARALGEVAHG